MSVSRRGRGNRHFRRPCSRGAVSNTRLTQTNGCKRHCPIRRGFATNRCGFHVYGFHVGRNKTTSISWALTFCTNRTAVVRSNENQKITPSRLSTSR